MVVQALQLGGHEHSHLGVWLMCDIERYLIDGACDIERYLIDGACDIERAEQWRRERMSARAISRSKPATPHHRHHHRPNPSSNTHPARYRYASILAPISTIPLASAERSKSSPPRPPPPPHRCVSTTNHHHHHRHSLAAPVHLTCLVASSDYADRVAACYHHPCRVRRRIDLISLLPQTHGELLLNLLQHISRRRLHGAVPIAYHLR